ncbi:MAG: lipase family protein [Planctomycetes bacterium]|nr:lipase family protein [Planctomycetota bacterium]
MTRSSDWSDLLTPGAADDWFASADAAPSLIVDARWQPGTAWWLAELSRLVYRDGELTAPLAAAGFALLHECAVDGTRTVLLRCTRGADCAALVCRGTASLRDWLVNVRAVRRSWRGPGRVHYGFRRALLRVWDQLEGPLATAPRELFFTGHSLGGALATLAATLHAPRATYTFGAPMVGDRAFVDALPPGLHRVVNGRDLVPTLPPTRGGYVHGGELHHLGAAGAADAIALASATAQLSAPSSKLAPHPALMDHAPRRYVELLRRLTQ